MPRTARASVGGYCYHALNRGNERARVFHGAGVTTQTAFDKDGNVTKTVQNGYTTTGQFDADNNRTASVDGDGKTTAYAFDAADQLTMVTDPDANGTTYGLDGDGLTTLVTSPQGYTTQQKFDGNGQITQRITPDGGTVNFTYDGDGRITSDGNGTRTYNGDGSLTTASNAYGTTGVESGKWRVESGEWPLATLHSPLSTRAVGNQTLVTDSLGGTESSTYDGDGYLTARSYVGQGQTLLVKYTNNEEGWNTTLARYSNLAGTTLVATSKYQYDGAGNVTNVQDTGPSGGAIDQFAYALDSNGNLTSETDTQGGTATTTDYSYDSAGQLTSAGGSSYGYDANGNRDTGSDTVTTGNEMTADANWDYKYDKEGELIEKDSTVVGSSEKWTYTWSANGNLTEAKHYNSSGTLVLDVTYEYDAFGEMIQKSDGTVTSRYVQDGWNSNMTAPTGNENMNTWAVLNGSNQWQERDIWGNQVGQELGRIVLAANNYSLYPMQDRQESVRDLTLANGTVDDSIAYDAFGNITSETNSALRGRYALTGRMLDVETDLQYNNARWYDPATGRWVSQDPLGFDAGDSNLYRYVTNRPTNDVDPSGYQDAPPSPLKIPTLKDLARGDVSRGQMLNMLKGERFSPGVPELNLPPGPHSLSLGQPWEVEKILEQQSDAVIRNVTYQFMMKQFNTLKEQAESQIAVYFRAAGRAGKNDLVFVKTIQKADLEAFKQQFREPTLLSPGQKSFLKGLSVIGHASMIVSGALMCTTGAGLLTRIPLILLGFDGLYGDKTGERFSAQAARTIVYKVTDSKEHADAAASVVEFSGAIADFVLGRRVPAQLAVATRIPFGSITTSIARISNGSLALQPISISVSGTVIGTTVISAAAAAELGLVVNGGLAAGGEFVYMAMSASSSGSAGGAGGQRSGQSGAGAPATPPHAQTTLNTVRTTGQPPAGYRGGGTFANDGRGGGQVLPRTTSNGTPITYAEYDVNPFTPGVNRGPQRLVVGSDGRAYYTGDHYGTFTEIVP